MEAYAAVHRANYGIHAFVTEHTAEIGLKVSQFQLVVQCYFQHRAHSLIKQPAFNGVVVKLQEFPDQIQSVVQPLQGQTDQQFQFQNGQLAPDGIVVKFNADQG